MAELTTILMTGFITTIVILTFGMFMFMLDFLIKKKNNIDIRLNYWTGGKTQVVRARGRVNPHDPSQVISNKLKSKYGFIAIPYFGSEYVYPTDKVSRLEYPISYYQGTFAPEIYEPKEKIKIHTMEIKEGMINGKKQKMINQVEKEIEQFIIQPVNYDIKRWSVEKETELHNKYANNGFWAKYGHMVVGAMIVGGCVVVGIMILVFSYQSGMNFSQAPEWVQEFTKNIAERVQPPG